MQITLTLPAGSPAGRIVVSGWMRWIMSHANGAPDKVRIYVGTSGVDCGTSDAFRSYASVASGLPTGNVEGMVPIQNQFLVPAGGGTFTFYLNTQQLQGGTFLDLSSNIEAVFHRQG